MLVELNGIGIHKKKTKKKTAMYRKLPGATKAKGLGASAQAAPKVL